MSYKKIITCLFIIFFAMSSRAQTISSINIDTCLNLATQNYPLAKQKGYLLALDENNLKGIDGSWLPQFSLSSRATYQSEVTSFSFPGFPSMIFPKDQYSIGVQVNQTIYDGGLTKQLKKTEKANTETEIQKNEVELYKIKDKIVQLYGNILLLKENLKVFDNYMDDIKSKKTKITSFLTNGTVLQSNLDVLEAELLKTQQKSIEALSNLKVQCQILSLLINKQVDENTLFMDFPGTEASSVDFSKRPEIKLLDLQQNLLTEKMELSYRKTLPHLSVFGDGAYGRPGYNFLNQNLRVYGMGGLSLMWNISGLYNLPYERKNLKINKNIIDEQKELFDLNIKSSMIQENAEIDKLRQLIAIDKSIIEKRKSITKNAADQLDHGSITSTDYLTELNAEKQAILNQRMHEIQLGIAFRNFRITTGN